MKEIYEKYNLSNCQQNNVYNLRGYDSLYSKKKYNEEYYYDKYNYYTEYNNSSYNNEDAVYFYDSVNSNYNNRSSKNIKDKNYADYDAYYENYINNNNSYRDEEISYNYESENNNNAPNYSNNYTTCTNAYEGLCIYKYGQDNIIYQSGESSDVDLSLYDCDVRVDISLQSIQSLFLWGEVRDSCLTPVSNVPIILFKPDISKGNCTYSIVASTYTDRYGYYTFNVPYCNNNTRYEVSIADSGTIC